MKNPVIVETRVSARQAQGRAERDLIRRHQAALREIDRWDIARESRPHIPRLANDILRQDDALDALDAIDAAQDRVMSAIVDMAGPCPLTGPRTGTHPMATTIDKPIPDPRPPMATYLRPPLSDERDSLSWVDRIPESLALTAFLIITAVLTAFFLV
jgi:hypothetical protein